MLPLPQHSGSARATSSPSGSPASSTSSAPSASSASIASPSLGAGIGTRASGSPSAASELSAASCELVAAAAGASMRWPCRCLAETVFTLPGAMPVVVVPLLLRPAERGVSFLGFEGAT
eukprot:scaffold109700_cov60-Phaeocystis_antarctica.AAC.1